MKKPDIEFRKEDATAVLILSGSVDEDTTFTEVLPLLGQMQARAVEINVGDVSFLNSCGAREWILFLERLQAKYPCHFSVLSQAWAEQASIILTLLGKKGTQVEAFHAPYFCEKCGATSDEVLATSEIRKPDGIIRAPRFKCKCGGVLTLDAPEPEYFYFLENH